MPTKWEIFCARLHQEIIAEGGSPDEVANAHLTTPDAFVFLAGYARVKTRQFLHPEEGDFDLLGSFCPTEEGARAGKETLR